jgi:hypothetical protein
VCPESDFLAFVSPSPTYFWGTRWLMLLMVGPPPERVVVVLLFSWSWVFLCFQFLFWWSDCDFHPVSEQTELWYISLCLLLISCTDRFPVISFPLDFASLLRPTGMLKHCGEHSVTWWYTEVGEAITDSREFVPWLLPPTLSLLSR